MRYRVQSDKTFNEQKKNEYSTGRINSLLKLLFKLIIHSTDT
jgi:hypothetical protein